MINEEEINEKQNNRTYTKNEGDRTLKKITKFF